MAFKRSGAGVVGIGVPIPEFHIGLLSVSMRGMAMPGKDLLLQAAMGVSFAGAAILILLGFWAGHRMKPGFAAHEPELFRSITRAMSPENAILGVALNRKKRTTLHPALQPGLGRIVLLHRMAQLCLIAFGVAFIASMSG